MRKQYHFRPSAEGLKAWDVERLIQLSIMLPVFQKQLSEIRELDEPHWYASSTEIPSCRNIAMHAKLMRDADLSYPIILFSDGGVVDGMHRVCKALIDGNSTIDAIQFTDDPDPDFVGLSPDQLPY